MKAIRFHTFGGPEVLHYEEVPRANAPGPTEVLLEIKAAALNHLDLWVRSGSRERSIPLPHIPGSDGAGVVAEVGSAVEFWKTGQKALISPGISCGHCPACFSGRDNLCHSYHVLGTREDGTNAGFVTLPAVNLMPIPDGLDFGEAASIPLVFLTAWHMLVALADLKPGETVLVHGAGSGVGSAGIQIGKFIGARVITTAGSGEKLAKAKALGADELINYHEQDFTEVIRSLTEKRGVDVVLEHIGGEILTKSIPILARGGRLVTCGATTAPCSSIDLRYVYSRHLTLLGSFMGTKKELADVLKFFSPAAGDRRLRPVVDSRFPLSEAAEAHRKMEERKNFGKIVLLT
jgi:NADPH:quinone reductase-like Zn-dependent oxidoreductase